jgi:type VI secretion system secreted protein Hcp
MAGNLFLKLDGVDGESVQKPHEKEIEIQTWSWGASNAANLAGGGSGQGSVSFQDIHITKMYDKSTATMMKKCAEGTHFATAKISMLKAGGGQQEFFTIKLKEVFITSISFGTHGDGAVTEQISLAFKDVEVIYKPQDDKGALGGDVKFGYNIGTKLAR